MSSTTTNPSPTWPIRQYTPRHPSWPYTPHDFTRPDPSADSTFYASPRFVTHIDDAAIASLREYYSQVLPPVPQTGPPPRILDLCSSWTSHFPPRIVDAVGRGEVEVWGLGMNARELERNPVFRDGGKWGVWDLNREGEGDVGVAVKETILKTARGSGEVEMGSPSPSKAQEEHEPCLDATTCVVSTDYLTQPFHVFSSLLRLTKPGGTVHLTISNRCFPTKAIARWLQVDEEERLQMVGDYLFFAGWKRIEIVELSDGRVRGGNGGGEGEQGGLGAFMKALGMDAGRRDPLWVVRGVKE
ncbi:hypothetical protein KC332_g617 [Hortaea werneckii]|uniref:Methyltransferase type 11 domain-containing protein n=1 Tax=Hortaea werneckii TaxID=91943 RepID=A0A3M7IXG4_HORWE|nr:hypothetical protein KC358_g16483 [Hortaea werneckii]KAI6816040.1 hypothetical protein KC350_g10875 [Hortaea werneckii]KAI6941228.1 hypothetical protein KC341_g3042 [Hortaea werneckii]KAI6945934.1 hypothetical protein KC348_g3481 [Hortaea werneckii]KAI6978068.1 hypothetical protein KC321_g3119 [Hortaea werneckii]